MTTIFLRRSADIPIFQLVSSALRAAIAVVLASASQAFGILSLPLDSRKSPPAMNRHLQQFIMGSPKSLVGADCNPPLHHFWRCLMKQTPFLPPPHSRVSGKPVVQSMAEISWEKFDN